MESDRVGFAIEAMERVAKEAGFESAADVPNDPDVLVAMPAWLVTMLEQVTGIPAEGKDN